MEENQTASVKDEFIEIGKNSRIVMFLNLIYSLGFFNSLGFIFILGNLLVLTYTLIYAGILDLRVRTGRHEQKKVVNK